METNQEKKYSTTLPYEWFKAYKASFLDARNVIEHLKEARDFYYGKQYALEYDLDTPKPILNLCREGADRVTAKITGTKRHISFVSDKDDESLDEIDNFYSYQLSEMDDETFVDEVTLASAIDGTGVQITTYDSDTLGIKGKYRGFLKRKNIPFETTFWSNPFTNDEQDQRYWGYYLDMDVGAVKEMVEGRDDGEIERKCEMIVPENFYSDTNNEKTVTDSDQTRVYIAFFRLEGEVYFEIATQYIYITTHPHALNPKLNESKISKLFDEWVEEQHKGVETRGDELVPSHKIDTAKYALFTKAVLADDSYHLKEKGKFSRYPVNILSLYPTVGCILGQSFVSMIIPNQKIINYLTLLQTLIIQNFAMPKILAKPSTLQGQEYDTSPNQVIIDYSTVQERGNNGWGIDILRPASAINSNLLSTRDSLITLTRQIFGFDNLDSEKFSADTSGYAYSMMVKQMNLVLEIPQKKLWLFVKNNAKLDLMYFKHYIDTAKYFLYKDPSEISLNENYRALSQNLIDSGKLEGFEDVKTKPTKRVYSKEINSKFFDDDFNVCIEVEQGIAGSELTESQHYNQIMGYVAQGNIQADILKAMVENDPAFSRKTRQRLSNSLESLELSQLAVKDKQIAQLEQALAQTQQYMQVTQKVVELQQKRQKAIEQASVDQAKMARELIVNSQQQSQNMSESEVKSNNAKGIAGTSFKGSNNS